MNQNAAAPPAFFLVRRSVHGTATLAQARMLWFTCPVVERSEYYWDALYRCVVLVLLAAGKHLVQGYVRYPIFEVERFLRNAVI